MPNSTSVGIEGKDDLIDDLRQCIKKDFIRILKNIRV